MFFVVPQHEGIDPLPGIFQALKGLQGKGWRVFQAAEQGFLIGVVITDRGPAEGWDDPQLLQGGQHGGGFHGATIVRMEDQARRIDTFGQAGLLDQDTGMGRTFAFMDLPAHDLAAVDIHDQVEFQEQTGHRRRQKSYIPAPDLVGHGGAMAGGFRHLFRRLGLAPVVELIGLP